MTVIPFQKREAEWEKNVRTRLAQAEQLVAEAFLFSRACGDREASAELRWRAESIGAWLTGLTENLHGDDVGFERVQEILPAGLAGYV